MNKFKRFILLTVVLCLILSLLSACSIGNKETINFGDEFTKRLDLTAWITQGNEYSKPVKVKENYVEQWLIDKTNVRIVNAYGNGGGQWESVLSRLVAGDDFPELVVCGGGQGPVHFGKIAEVGKIWELTPDMLKTYAPDIWEKVPDNMWERIKVDRKIYGIPYNFPVSTEEEYAKYISKTQLENAEMTEPVSLGTDLWIRDDILKMLYPEAKTWDELLTLMKEKGEPIGDEIYDVPIESAEDLIKLFKDIKSPKVETGYDKGYEVTFNYSGDIVNGMKLVISDKVRNQSGIEMAESQEITLKTDIFTVTQNGVAVKKFKKDIACNIEANLISPVSGQVKLFVAVKNGNKLVSCTLSEEVTATEGDLLTASVTEVTPKAGEKLCIYLWDEENFIPVVENLTMTE